MKEEFKLLEETTYNGTKSAWFNNGENIIKLHPGDEIPDGYVHGRLKGNRIPWNKGLTKDIDERVALNGQHTKETRTANKSYIAWNKGLTKETDSRVVGHPGESNGMYGKHHQAWNKGLTKDSNLTVKQISNTLRGRTPWNKGLTVETDSRVKAHPQTDETKNKIRKAHQSVEVKLRRFNTMKSNNTLGLNSNTEAEKECFKELQKRFPNCEIISQYFDKERYPYHCDFYIPEQDLFVEVHANWTHGGMPFDKNNKECQKQLADWQEKSKTSKYYQNAIYTWTILDVKKLEIAKQNNLNFEVIYYKYR